MAHPILALQASLLTALGADAALVLLNGVGAVFDAPPKGIRPPYVVIARHDLLPRDGDLAPFHEHRVQLHIWGDEASRKLALAIAERIIATVLAADLSGGGHRVTHKSHVRTESGIDPETGQGRAAVTLKFFSEPAA